MQPANFIYLLLRKHEEPMIYKFKLISDESSTFSREIEIDADNTFMELHNIISESVNYEKNEMTAFFLCDENWEKELEITLVEMDTSSEYDSHTMENTVISDFITEKNQNVLYIFDMFSERGFIVRLKDIKPGHLEKAVCTAKKGEAPQQIVMGDFEDTSKKNVSAENFEEEFYGDEGFNEDEFDEEGFSDMSFDENEY